MKSREGAKERRKDAKENAKAGRNRNRDFRSTRAHGWGQCLTPSPGTPGEGWSGGNLEIAALVLEITLTPALSRSTGRGSSFPDSCFLRGSSYLTQ